MVICHFLDNLPNKIECEHNGMEKIMDLVIVS